MRVDRECADIERKRVAATKNEEEEGETRRGWLVGWPPEQRFHPLAPGCKEWPYSGNGGSPGIGGLEGGVVGSGFGLPLGEDTRVRFQPSSLHTTIRTM